MDKKDRKEMNMDKENLKQQAEQIVDKVKALVQEGNVSRVMLMRRGEILVNIPMTAGIVGTIIGLKAAPFAVLTAALVSFGLDCEIVIEKADGTITNLNETDVGVKLGEIKENVKDKARDIFDKD